MQKQLCLISALALSGVLLLAGPGLAQKQGGGPGGGPAGNQVCTGGVCTINPAAPANPNCPGPGAGKSQKRQRMKGARSGAQANQPAPQTTQPEAGQ